MGHKILVTGCGGYIGSVAADLFLQKGYQIVGVDNFSTGYRQPLEYLQKKYGSEKFRFHELDLKDGVGDFFQKEKGIEAVVHYAAHCLVNESMEDPGKYFRNNVFGSLNLITAATAAGIDKFVFSSTCATYGEAEYVPVDEAHPQKPTNPYGQSKKMVEELLGWFDQLKGLRSVILRYFNVCGAADAGDVGDAKKPSVLLVQNAVRGALGIEPFFLTCPKVDTPDGTPIRDYINVVDLNEAHHLALDYLFKGGQSQVINLGTGQGNSVLEIVATVQQVTGTKFAYESTTPRKGEYAKMIAATAKAKKVLGWQPERTIENSVNSLVKWYQAHPKGWGK